MPAPLPPWPPRPPAHGPVVLRPFSAADLPMALDLSTDPYVPLIGSLPANATAQQALDWIERNRSRWAEGAGFSFAIALAQDDRAVGVIGLWLAEMGAGRASVGYCVAPSERGHGYASAALNALTSFAWSIPALQRLQLRVEPWNLPSIRTAERAGYRRVALLPAELEIGGRERDVLQFVATRPQPPRGSRGTAVTSGPAQPPPSSRRARARRRLPSCIACTRATGMV